MRLSTPRDRAFPLAFLFLLSLALVAADADAQDPSAEPSFGYIELDAGFMPDPHSVELTAGGTISVDEAGCAYGQVSDAPDYDLYYETDKVATLYISVIAGDDTTLLVNRPDGTWVCDDDGYGDLDPIVVIPKAQSGLYDIWVGTYGEELVSATLYISEVDPRR